MGMHAFLTRLSVQSYSRIRRFVDAMNERHAELCIKGNDSQI